MLDPRVPADPETWLVLNLTLRCGMAGHDHVDAAGRRGPGAGRRPRAGRPGPAPPRGRPPPRGGEVAPDAHGRLPQEFLFQRRTDPRARPGAFYNSRRKVLRKRVRRRARQVGVRTNVCPMVLRHTYALAALRAGANPRNVARQLGYGSMKMMTIYLNELARDTTWDVRRHPVRY